MAERRGYPTMEDAMQATLRDNNTPLLRGRLVRKNGVDVRALALELGTYVRYDRVRDVYAFPPGE